MELEQWSNSLGGIGSAVAPLSLEQFWGDAIKRMALSAAYNAFGRHLEERFQPGKTARMNPGSLSRPST